jgi:hypothetical protein
MTSAALDGRFTLSQPEREAKLLSELTELTEHHYSSCPPYARILDAVDGTGSRRAYAHCRDLPWLPVRMFKHHTLKSIPDAEVFTTVTSSGTTGDVSRIHLDRAAAATQQRALSETLRAVMGPHRLPMLIADSQATLARGRPLSARGAGILGMMMYGKNHTFLLDADEQLDPPAVRGFLAAHGDRPFLVFGFTYLVWSQLQPLAVREGLDLSNGVLVHTGGWKKLADRAVTAEEFRRGLELSGLRRVHDFYGMAEQIGTVFVEGPDTHDLYCPDFADVIIREPLTWREAPVGTPGVIEVLSTLPRSYPGHVLLTEDVGVVHGVDDGDWPGKRFSVLGRLPRAEARGCSDAVGAP